MTKRLTLTLRDMYAPGTDTIELEGKLVDAFWAATDKSAFLTKLETVSFTNPYIVKAKKALDKP